MDGVRPATTTPIRRHHLCDSESRFVPVVGHPRKSKARASQSSNHCSQLRCPTPTTQQKKRPKAHLSLLSTPVVSYTAPTLTCCRIRARRRSCQRRTAKISNTVTIQRLRLTRSNNLCTNHYHRVRYHQIQIGYKNTCRQTLRMLQIGFMQIHACLRRLGVEGAPSVPNQLVG